MQNTSKITKSNSQGLIFVIISGQRACCRKEVFAAQLSREQETPHGKEFLIPSPWYLPPSSQGYFLVNSLEIPSGHPPQK